MSDRFLFWIHLGLSYAFFNNLWGFSPLLISSFAMDLFMLLILYLFGLNESRNASFLFYVFKPKGLQVLAVFPFNGHNFFFGVSCNSPLFILFIWTISFLFCLWDQETFNLFYHLTEQIHEFVSTLYCFIIFHIWFLIFVSYLIWVFLYIKFFFFP